MQKPGLELWGRANAYNVQKPLWLLAEMNFEFNHYEMGSTAGDLETPDFLALNPNARVPVVRVDEAIVWESNTILRFLANRFGVGNLYPDAAHPRSLVERWMDWELASLQPAFIDLFWGYYRTPAANRDQDTIERVQRRCQALFSRLDQQLETTEYLAGNDFSIADIACGVCLYRYFNMGLEVERPPSLMGWYQRLSQRPAFRNTIMQPFDDLRGRIQF